MIKNMKRNSIKLLSFFILISSAVFILPFVQPALAGEDITQSIQNLTQKSDNLNKETDALLKLVRKMRVDELEKMRIDVLKKLQRWEDEEAEMDGQALQVALQNAYFVAEGYGMDIPRLRKLYELTKRVIRRADFPQFCGSGVGTMKEFTEPVKDSAVFGNVVHFFDLVDKKEERMACVQKHKVELYKEINREFLRALSTPDPAAAAASFRKYANALRTQVTGQEVEALQADLKALADEQANVALFFSIIPLVGDAMDAMAIKEGEDIAGQKLSAMEKSFAAVMLLMPNALEMVVKRLARGSADTVKWVVGYLRKIADTEGTMLNAAAKKAGTSVDALKGRSKIMLARLGESAPARVAGEIGNKTVAYASEAMDKATESARKWAKSADGSKTMETWNAAKKAGSDKVNQIKELLAKEGADEDALLNAYQGLRMDKMALDELQKGKYKPLREQIKKIEDDLFGSIKKIKSDELGEYIPVPTLGKVDKDAIDGLKAGFKGGKDVPVELQELLDKAKKKMRSKVKGIANKNGVPMGSFDPDEYLDFDDLEITVFNATNKPPSPDKIGFDRDITYRVKIPEEKVKVINTETGVMETITIPPTAIDLPADVVSQYYNQSLHKHLNPGKTPPKIGSNRLKEFGENMDHVVTDEFAIDSYRIGADVRKFFKDPTLLDRLKSKGGDIGDTVTHKSREWFHKADDLGPGTGKGMWHTKEGMRQATKQFDNYATSLQKYYDPASIKKIPPKLENGLGVFKKVKEGTMSVPEAERALQALGTNKEEVVELFGSYFEGVLKTGKRK